MVPCGPACWARYWRSARCGLAVMGSASGRLGKRFPELGQQLVLPGEHLGEDPARGAHQLGDIAASECVDDGGAVTGGGDDARPAQYRQLLGQAGRLDVDLGEQVAHRLRPVLEQFENSDAHRMAEHPEELSLGLVQRYRHRTSSRHCLSFLQYTKLKTSSSRQGTG